MAPTSTHRGEGRITATAPLAASVPSVAVAGSHTRQKRNMSIATSPQWNRYVASRLEQFASSR
jgi:hypothetical protein